jgi:hypothetical protein
MDLRWHWTYPSQERFITIFSAGGLIDVSDERGRRPVESQTGEGREPQHGGHVKLSPEGRRALSVFSITIGLFGAVVGIVAHFTKNPAVTFLASVLVLLVPVLGIVGGMWARSQLNRRFCAPVYLLLTGVVVVLAAGCSGNLPKESSAPLSQPTQGMTTGGPSPAVAAASTGTASATPRASAAPTATPTGLGSSVPPPVTPSALTTSVKTTDEFCFAEHNTCFGYPYTRYYTSQNPDLVLPIVYEGGYNAELVTSYNWPAENFVAAGTYTGPVNGKMESKIPVTNITLGRLVQSSQPAGNTAADGYISYYTCLKFTVPAMGTSPVTTVELYNIPPLGTGYWNIVASCM